MATGLSVQRLDAVAKVTGRARYTEDLGMPGMRHAVYVRSPHAHARVRDIRTEAARALPGVDAVFTFADVPQTLFATAGHPYALDPADADVADRRLLTDYARFQGDEVAIVVARDIRTARAAAALVEVDWEPLPALATTDAALAQGAPALHATGERGNLLGESVVGRREEAAAALAASATRAAGVFVTPVQQHCHLEPFAAYAYMEEGQRITVVSSTQIPHICRRITAQVLGMDWSMVRVVKPCVGGGFGAKQDVVLEPMVAFLTRALGGRPVCISLTREECLSCTRTRHAFRMEGRVGVDAGGHITALALDVLSNTGAYASHGHTIALAGCGKLAGLYPHAAYACRARTVYTTTPVAGAMRGYGAPQLGYAIECLVEDAARACGKDSVDFRLENVARVGDTHPLAHYVLQTAEAVACLEKGRELFHWDARRRACVREGAVRQGVGVACFSYSSSVYPASVELAGARMTLHQDGRVTLMSGAVEIGQGADTALAQMAAQTLGMDVDCIHVLSTQDTDITPLDPGAFASRQTYVSSNAVRLCAEKLRRKILEQAAVMLQTPVSALDIRGRDVVGLSGGEAVLSLRELALDACYHKERGLPITAEAAHKTTSNALAFGCTFVWVEVDIPQCRLRVLDMLNVHDSGVIINPRLARGQVQGGAAMGLGYALYEELLVDAVSGAVRNNTLLDYKVPTCMDVPDIRTAFVESHEPSGGYGNKALGEPPTVSPAPALRNALLDATGLAVNELPLSPKTLYRHFLAAGILQDAYV